MTSFEKKDANKRNAAKSTGPKTETGKRSVRLNALRHGFYAHELTVRKALKCGKRHLPNLRLATLQLRAVTCNAQSIGTYISDRKIFSLLPTRFSALGMVLLEQSQ